MFESLCYSMNQMGNLNDPLRSNNQPDITFDLSAQYHLILRNRKKDVTHATPDIIFSDNRLIMNLRFVYRLI